MIGTKEFYDLVAEFEEYAKKNVYGSLEREKPVQGTPANCFYVNGNVNAAFLAFMAGYQLHKCIANMESAQ